MIWRSRWSTVLVIAVLSVVSLFTLTRWDPNNWTPVREFDARTRVRRVQSCLSLLHSAHTTSRAHVHGTCSWSARVDVSWTR